MRALPSFRTQVASAALMCLVFAGCDKKSGERAADRSPSLVRQLARRGFVVATTDQKPGSVLYTLTNGNWTAKLDVYDHTELRDAETLIEDGILGIEALYANALSPYPGDLSSQVSGDPRFRPRLVTNNVPPAKRHFVLYANGRLGYGASTADALRFKSLLGWIYCPREKELWKIRLFAPLTTPDPELDSLFRALRCD